MPILGESATQPFLVSSRNAPISGGERCVTTLKTAGVAD